MKLSLVSAALAALSLSALVGCSDDPSAPQAPAPTPAATEAPPPPARARALVTKRPMATSPENLLVDPHFQSLWTPLDETGFGIYEAFVQDGTRDVEFRPVTPAGPGEAVLTVSPGGGGATLTMTVVGGKGPISARVWVAYEKTAPEIELVSLYEQRAIILQPEEASRTTVDGKSYVRFSGASATDMPGALYFVATVRGAPARFVAPEVTADGLGQGAKSAIGTAPALRAPSERARAAAERFERLRAAHVTMSAPPAPRLLRGRLAPR